MKDIFDGDDTNGREVNLGRHRAQCSVCKHLKCKEIEELWLDWASPEKIAYDFQISKDAIRRHSRALKLDAKRQKNRMRICERMLERADLTKPTGATVLGFYKEYDKHATRQESMPAESQDPKALFQRMTMQERANFLRDGTLPDWFSGASDPKTGIDHGKVNEAENPETHSVQ